MSEKEHISATVDPEVSAYLSRDSINASGLVNDLVKQQMSSGGDSEELIRLRLEQVNSEIQSHHDDIDRLEDEREILNQRLDRLQESEDEERKEKLRKLKRVPNDPSHPLVRDVAQDLGIEPETALEEAQEL